MVVIDDDQEGEPGNERNTDGFFNDAEVHFTGSTGSDNGLEVGARIELEGETDNSMGGDQIDEAWIWFSGGFGEIRIGSDDEALANACIVPPGGTGNFSAFSPNQWGANSVTSNAVCTGVDALAKSDAQKIIYITPNFYGFQLTASYTPEPSAEDHIDGAGPHVGMPSKSFGSPNEDASVYLTYQHEGDGWGLTWGAGGSWQIENQDVNGAHFEEADFYQTGLNLTFGNFAIGGAFEYFNDLAAFDFGPFFHGERDTWVAGGGVSYVYDAWTFGAQYSFRKDKDSGAFFGPESTQRTYQQRAVLTTNYALGPGINVDGELAYTWVDTDPEEDPIFIDDYDAFEIGIGTAITF